MRNLFILIFIVIANASKCEIVDYNIANIPENIKIQARSVIRIDNELLEISNEKQATLSVKYAITILNKNGADDAIFKQFYNKFYKIANIKATVYDENGKRIRKISNNDIRDFSAIDGFSTYADSRIKIIDPENRNYPFTVEYEFQIIFKGTLQLPSWNPISDFEISVQHSEIKVIVPESLEIRYLEKNISNTLNHSKIGTNNIYYWSADNLPALKEEPFSGPLSDYSQEVQFAMNAFSIGGVAGDASNWGSFGKWVYNLNKGRNLLPEESVSKLNNLVKDAKSTFDSINILYQYMQNNTRYVSVQVGIGGWQAFEAETVDRLGYGDCKALSNYMQAILESVGIKAYYTLVYAGNYAANIDVNFPSNQFNHVILCVPGNNDTIWLECTSQTLPCGYLGRFTDDRDVLLIKESGGEITHTPVSSKTDNIQTSYCNVSIDIDGNAVAQVKKKYMGVYYDINRIIIQSDDADKKKLLYKSYNIPHFTIKSFRFDETKSRMPYINENAVLELNNYCTKMGLNVFFTVNLTNKTDESPKKLKNRISDIYIRSEITEIDTIIYKLPTGFNLTGLPENIIINSDFGNFTTQYSIIEDNIQFIRNLSLNKGVYPKEDYQLLINFFEGIIKSDQQKIALKQI